MKKIIYIILFLLIAMPLFGQSTVIVAKKKAACTYTSKNAQTGTGADLNYISTATANKAISFAANGTYSPRRITASLKKTGSPTVTIQFIIRQDAGESTSRTEPGDVVISVVTYEAEDLTTSYADYNIDIPIEQTAELTNANVYWLQIYGGVGASNYVQWQYSTSGDEEENYTTAPPTTWTEYDTSMTGNFTIWSCE